MQKYDWGTILKKTENWMNYKPEVSFKESIKNFVQKFLMIIGLFTCLGFGLFLLLIILIASLSDGKKVQEPSAPVELYPLQ